MKVALYHLIGDDWTSRLSEDLVDSTKCNLVLCFGAKHRLQQKNLYHLTRVKFPAAQIAMVSTSGEIYHGEILDHSMIAIAMEFEKSFVKSESVNIKDFQNSYSAAIHLAKQIQAEDLVHVLVLSDGSKVNGSELVMGLTSQINKKVLITGGLAGDGSEFKSTLVGLNKQPIEGEIIAIGFYGEKLKVTHGSQGGWDIFGLEKRVTNSSGNVLLEIEDQNALDLYKKYLGEEVKNLPGSALLFPLSVTLPGSKKPIVRTILSINEENKSMTFAGDVPVGSVIRFMKANFEKITMAASEAANQTMTGMDKKPDFSLLISCVGRKLILGEKTIEEVKAVEKLLNHETIMAGFYSYGEIAPFHDGGSCQLHNQTMTITSYFEY